MNNQVDSQVELQTPKEVKFSNLIPVGYPASTFKRKFFANKTTFTPSDNTVRIYLNSSGFLDLSQGMLKFTVKNLNLTTPVPPAAAAASPAKIDGSAHSFIQRLTVYGPDMTILDQVENYNIAASILSDIQLSRDYRSTIGNALAGYSKFVGTAYTVTAAAHTETLAGNASRSFHLPLVSGFLGLNNRYLPAQFVSGNGIQIELLLAPATEALICTNATDVPNYEISDVWYECPVIDFKGNFYSEFKQILDQGGIKWHTTNWTTNRKDFAANASTTLSIGSRHRSLKSVIAVFQTKTAKNEPKTSYHELPNANGTYQFRIGSTLYPPEPVRYNVDNYSELMSEILKSVSSLHSIKATSVVDKDNLFAGAGCIALDFENYAHNSFELESGLNTITNNLPMDLVCQCPGTGGVCYMFCLHDIIYMLTPQGLIVKSN